MQPTAQGRQRASLLEYRREQAMCWREVQRNVLYLGEVNDSQREAWCEVIEAFDEGTQQPTQLALFPAVGSFGDNRFFDSQSMCGRPTFIVSV
jgi:hypothetical protein